jgi:5-formyltetrahydrofolate cyclo-ligase
VRSQDLKRAKRAVRRRVLDERDAVPIPDREAAAAAVTERFLALPEVHAARSVLAFSSFGSEVPLDPLIEILDARGVVVALPVIVGEALEARVYRPGAPTTTTSFGAREPADGRPFAPEELDVIVTPAVAYDRAGRRVGYGGGFYDRFLPRTRSDAVRIGVGLGLQLLDEELPAGSFDLAVDIVVTPEEAVRCRR